MSTHFKAVNGTAPSALLYDGEELITTQEGVGLYDGKEKTQGRQDGTIILTTHRLLYIDQALPKLNSIGLNLSAVRQTEFYAGFLTSSPKVSLLLKTSIEESESPASVSLLNDDEDSIPLPLGASWVCAVCGYKNLPSVNEGTPICGMCGVRKDNRAYAAAPKTQVSHHLPPKPISRSETSSPVPSQTPSSSLAIPSSFNPDFDDSISCTACTYLNHPSMRTCEICDTPLPRWKSVQSHSVGSTPLVSSLATTPKSDLSAIPVEVPLPSTDVMRISFRRGGYKDFYNSLKKALLRKAWASEDSRGIARNSENSQAMARSGIQGIFDTVDMTSRVVNSNMGTGLRDLEALMTKAKEMVELASSLNTKLTAQEEEISRKKAMFPDLPLSVSAPASPTQPEEVTFIRKSMGELGLPTMAVTQDMVKDEKKYHEELAKELAIILNGDKYLANGTHEMIIPLDELWRTWNRARGVALVPPASLIECVAYLSRHSKLPLTVRSFRSGAKALQTPAFDEDVCSTRILSVMESDVDAEYTTVALAGALDMPVGLAEDLLEDSEANAFIVRDDGIGMGQIIWHPNRFNDFEWDGTDEIK